MGSSSTGQQQQQQFRRGVSSSWSDYRDFDKLNNPQQQQQQQQFLVHQQQNSVHSRSASGLVKVRSSSYDHDYYQEDYNRGQRGDGQGPAAERSLPVVQQQLRQQQRQQQQRHPHHHHHRQHQSSSEEELRSTSECTSCEDVEVESESVSEKGKSSSNRRKKKKSFFLSNFSPSPIVSTETLGQIYSIQQESVWGDIYHVICGSAGYGEVRGRRVLCVCRQRSNHSSPPVISKVATDGIDCISDNNKIPLLLSYFFTNLLSATT